MNRALTLREVADRLHMSYEWARHLMAAGTFPIPALRRNGARGHWRFSEAAVERYLASDTSDAQNGAVA